MIPAEGLDAHRRLKWKLGRAVCWGCLSNARGQLHRPQEQLLQMPKKVNESDKKESDVKISSEETQESDSLFAVYSFALLLFYLEKMKLTSL